MSAGRSRRVEVGVGGFGAIDDAPESLVILRITRAITRPINGSR
jgi:hypothetical protein